MAINRPSDHPQIASFVDASGGLGRPVPCATMLVPRVEYSNGGLVARWRFDLGVVERHPNRQMLTDFLNLKDAPDERIVRYASHWGLLGVRAEILTSEVDFHSPKQGWRKQAYSTFRLEPLPQEGIELLTTWRMMSGRAYDLLNLARKLNDGSITEDELSPYDSVDPDDENPIGIEAAREGLSLEINHWMRLGGVTFRMAWLEDELGDGRFGTQMVFESSHCYLLGALGIQMVLLVSDSGGLFSCHGCGSLVVVPRNRARPSATRSNYCESCKRQNVPLRKADERRKRKMIEARAMAATGTPPEEIAAALDTNVRSVRRWTKGAAKKAVKR